LFNGWADAGQHFKLEFSGENLSAGFYIYRLPRGNNMNVLNKMVMNYNKKGLNRQNSG
jgi:hypothetical protein